MAWPPVVHSDVYDDLNGAHGPFTSLAQRNALGEQLVRGGGPLWVSGRVWTPSVNGSALTSLTVTASRLYLAPIWASKIRNVSQIQTNVNTGATGSVRMGLYAADLDTGFPTTLIVDGGAALSTATSGVKNHAVSLGVEGLIWLAFTATAISFSAIPAAGMAPIAGSTSVAVLPPNYIYPTTTYAPTSALPSTLVGSSWNYTSGAFPLIGLLEA